jgi:hypothetical protein
MIGGLLVVLAIATLAAIGGIWLGILIAPRVGRLADRADRLDDGEDRDDDRS